MVWRTLAVDSRLAGRGPGRALSWPRPLVLGAGFVLGALAESALAHAPALRARFAARAPLDAPAAHVSLGAPAAPASHGAPTPRDAAPAVAPADATAPTKALDACDARAIALEAGCDPPLTSDGTCPPSDPSNLLYYVNRWFPISPRYPVPDFAYWTPCQGPIYGIRYDLICLPPEYSYGSNALRRSAFESPAPAAPARTFDGREVGFRGKVGFRALFDAAREEGGYTIYVRSGFRPYGTQAAVFRRWVNEEEKLGFSHAEALARASIASAREGHSEHQLGTTADLVYRTERGPIYEGWAPEIIAESPPMKWVRANAHRFGLVLTYDHDKEKITQYQWEPWHYRYVGVAAADAMRRCNLSTEEYLNARYSIGPLPRHPDAAKLFATPAGPPSGR